jgi:hypothetical protein
MLLELLDRLKLEKGLSTPEAISIVLKMADPEMLRDWLELTLQASPLEELQHIERAFDEP